FHGRTAFGVDNGKVCVVHSVLGGVAAGPVHGPGGGVHPHDLGLGRAGGHGQGDGAVSASQIEQTPCGGRFRDALQQYTGTEVDLFGREHAPIGVQPQVQVGQDQVGGGGPTGGAGIGIEVVLGHAETLSADGRK